jgi:hypothetical protein
MKLVPDWKDVWRWHSAQLLAALTVLPLVWMELPPDVKAYIPPTWHPWIVAAMAFAGFVGRLRAQE